LSRVTVMDRYHQIPPVGPPQNWMLGNTMLAGIAARTRTIALGLLVGGVTYSNPAQHAKDHHGSHRRDNASYEADCEPSPDRLAFGPVGCLGW
jgi:alkanesulfonate monooxygenase SsuD/methylene tetrahydromethanopterin reductase-like flavin-dependent oxidoreductase (luciferase family)